MEFIIEKMEKAHLDEVAQVFMETFNDSGENWTLEKSTKHVNEIYTGDCNFVAKQKEKILGILLAFEVAWEQDMELFIDTLAILPECQGAGIGKRLYRKAYNYAKNKRLKGIRFLANPEFESYKWYKRMGYSETGWVEMNKDLSDE